MKSRGIKILMSMGAAALVMGSVVVQASPEDDRKAFQTYYVEKFPNTEFSDFNNGVYSISESFREQWESIEEFPPYETFVEEGEEEWNKPFKNGKGYSSCFGDNVSAIRPEYPRWDAQREQVVTLEGELNRCRTDNG